VDRQEDSATASGSGSSREPDPDAAPDAGIPAPFIDPEDVELNQYLQLLLAGAPSGLPGHVSQLAPGATIELPELQPGDLPTLPDQPGIYRVETYSGTVHILTIGRGPVLWERRPAQGSGGAAYDGKPVRCRLSAGWAVGDLGRLTVLDGGYLYGATTHRTSFIMRITRIGDSGDDR
jgi:hypothetical protein